MKSCYNILNDGGRRSLYKKSIQKSAATLKVKIFDWLVYHDNILFKANLQKMNWTSSLHYNLCNYPVESLHIFLHSRVIWDFFLSVAHEILYRINISDIFSLHYALKVNISYQGRNSLVLAILWTLWLNKNAINFRNLGRNINSIYHHILLLTTFQTDTLIAGQDNLSQTLKQVKQDWDQTYPAISTSNAISNSTYPII